MLNVVRRVGSKEIEAKWEVWKITRTRTPVQVICEHLLVALSRNQRFSFLTPMVIKKVLREDKLQKMIINTVMHHEAGYLL